MDYDGKVKHAGIKTSRHRCSRPAGNDAIRRLNRHATYATQIFGGKEDDQRRVEKTREKAAMVESTKRRSNHFNLGNLSQRVRKAKLLENRWGRESTTRLSRPKAQQFLNHVQECSIHQSTNWRLRYARTSSAVSISASASLLLRSSAWTQQFGEFRQGTHDKQQQLSLPLAAQKDCLVKICMIHACHRIASYVKWRHGRMEAKRR